MANPNRFVVLIEYPNGKVAAMGDEDGGERFPTAEAARAAARGAIWEHSWVWWIVELQDDGAIRYGLELDHGG